MGKSARLADLLERVQLLEERTKPPHIHQKVYFKEVHGWPRDPDRFNPEPMYRYGWKCVGEQGCGASMSTGLPAGITDFPDTLR